jgi:hypothetical protein
MIVRALITGIAMLLTTGAAHADEWQPKRRHLICDDRGCTYDFGNSDAYEKAHSEDLARKYAEKYKTPPKEFDRTYDDGVMMVFRTTDATWSPMDAHEARSAVRSREEPIARSLF